MIKINTKTCVFASMMGIIGCLIFIIMFSLAVYFDGTWAFTVNDLSDLGVSHSLASVVLFNSACVITGVLMSVYAIEMSKVCIPSEKIPYIMCAVGCFCLIFVGMITEDAFRMVHIAFAFTMFIIVGISALIIMVCDYKNRRYLRALVIAGLTCVIAYALTTQNFATYEVISVAAMLFWVTSRSIMIILDI